MSYKIKRHIDEKIKEDLKRKIVLLSGPRQCGKTTLSRGLFSNADYLNYDIPEDRLRLIQKQWDRSSELVVLDELHKLKNWKNFLKGIFDKDGVTPPVLVTGSARLETFRKSGDSLAGRQFHYHLLPLDLKELKLAGYPMDSDAILMALMRFGGFPEPFLEQDETFYRRWKRSYNDSVIRQDLRDIEDVKLIGQLELLVELLRSRVGSPISYTALAEDIQVSPNTIKLWLTILERLYVIFKVLPYHRHIARSILKEPKYYFFDTGYVKGDEGSRFENLVALSLYKELLYREDTQGYASQLFFLKDKQKHEVDFLTVLDGKPTALVEVKWSDTSISPHLKFFKEHYFSTLKTIQLVHSIGKPYSTEDGIQVCRASEWLETVLI